MRAIMRFLILGIVAFVGLFGESQPAHADDKLEVGNYRGEIDMAVHLRSSQQISGGGATFNGNVTINWFGNAPFNLTIINDEKGLVSISSLPVDIFDNSYVEATSAAGNCYASTGIRAKGRFDELGTGSVNFNPQQKTGKVSLIFGGLEGVEIVYDTVQGCWKNTMAEAQLTALEQTSHQLGQNLMIKVTIVEEGYLRGTCSIPDWQGPGSLPNGSYDHIVDGCFWWALQEGEHEWKNK